MTKAAEAFRTISEVADALGIPAHVLRFWESKFPQVKPVKRAGGRRYYRPTDVTLLAGIKTLLHDQGMSIRGVQKILREQGAKQLSELAAATPVALPISAPTRGKPAIAAAKAAPATPSPVQPGEASVPPAENAAIPEMLADATPMLFDALPPNPKVTTLRQRPAATAPAAPAPLPWAERLRATGSQLSDPAPLAALYARLVDLRARIAARTHA